MRDLISKGLLTAAAATSVLSLGGGNAFASDAQGAAVGSPGVLSGNNVQVPVHIPVNVCGNTVDAAGVGNPAFGNACANTTAQYTHRQYDQAYRNATSETAATSATDGSSRTAGHDEPGSSARSATPATQTATQTAPAADRTGAPTTLPAPAHKPIPRPQSGQAADQAVPSPAHSMGTPGAAAPQHQQSDSAPVYGNTGAMAGDVAAGVPSVSAGTGAQATGTAAHSPGLLSGNLVQLPLDIPVNACGNSVDVVGALNPAFGNHCTSDNVPPAPPSTPDTPTPPPPPTSDTPPPVPVTPHNPPGVPVHHTPYVPPTPHVRTPPVPQLAHTGADADLLGAAALSAGLLLGGSVLYRRSTARVRARSRA